MLFLLFYNLVEIPDSLSALSDFFFFLDLLFIKKIWQLNFTSSIDWIEKVLKINEENGILLQEGEKLEKQARETI